MKRPIEPPAPDLVVVDDPPTLAIVTVDGERLPWTFERYWDALYGLPPSKVARHATPQAGRELLPWLQELDAFVAFAEVEAIEAALSPDTPNDAGTIARPLEWGEYRIRAVEALRLALGDR